MNIFIRSSRMGLCTVLLLSLGLWACGADKKTEAPTAKNPKISESQEQSSLENFTSKQMKGVEQISVKVDIDGAAKRLAKAVEFKTISNQDRDDFDTKAFSDYHAYLEKTYPNVHKTLKKEVLGEPRPYSLLYTWKGKDPSLQPALFYAHQDVVPVPSESRDQWSQDPFGGVIADGYIWGRGVLDDKNQIHGILEAAEMRIKEG